MKVMRQVVNMGFSKQRASLLLDELVLTMRDNNLVTATTV